MLNKNTNTGMASVYFRFISIKKNIMMFKYRLFVILLGCLSMFGLKAQDTLNTKVWTLESCIDYALDHNVNIKKQYLNVNYQESVLNQSKLGILPNVNAFARHGYNWGPRVDPFNNEFATDRVR